MNLKRNSTVNHARDERGATLILAAISMVLLIAGSALGVDVGRTVVVNRSLQTIADAGAIDAARYLDITGVTNTRLTTEAQHAATDNGSHATVNAIQGTMSGTSFVAGPGQYVKVTAGSTLQHLFEPGSSALNRSAIAEAVPPNAGFSIGTYLASLNSQSSSVLNPLLSVLGTTVNLSLVGYQGLAATDVSIQQLIDASMGLLTPTNVLSASFTTAQWDSWLASAVASQAGGLGCSGTSPSGPCTANTALSAQGPIGGTLSFKLCQIVSINGSTCSTTLSQSALSASVDVLQTLTTEAELANGTSALTLGASVLGGLATISTSLLQIPQVAYGPIGTTASTGQVNVAVTIAGLASVSVTAATGTAKFTGDTCTNNAMTTKLTVNTSAATVTVGLNVLGILVLGLPVTVTGVTNDVLSFPQPPPPTTQTVGSTNPGLGALSSALTTLLNPILQALGVSVANADVTDLSASCSPVELVQ